MKEDVILGAKVVHDAGITLPATLKLSVKPSKIAADRSMALPAPSVDVLCGYVCTNSARGRGVLLPWKGLVPPGQYGHGGRVECTPRCRLFRKCAAGKELEKAIHGR